MVLKNVESWAELVKWAAGPGVMGPGGVAPSARSSKESFQQFRRAALQKEREKALRGPDKIRYRRLKNPYTCRRITAKYITKSMFGV